MDNNIDFRKLSADKKCVARKSTHISGWLAISPIVVFLLLYLAVSIVIGDFYKMPIAAALAVASIWSVVIYKGRTLQKRIDVFSRSAGNVNILYMIWVFILAGAFANIAKETGSVEATVGIALRVFPAGMVVPMLFFASCFISLSIGTSVGTVVALTPLAVEMAGVSGENVAFYVAIVLGGAFFGDNLSFISDTTIAATRTQGCSMSDKFKANLWIALPAAIFTLGLYIVMGLDTSEIVLPPESKPWLVIPYIVVIALAVAGVNVMAVLTAGIVAALALGGFSGYDFIEMATFAGDGMAEMGNLIIITLLAAGMLGVIDKAGGIDFILRKMTRGVSGVRGAQTVIATLTGIVNLCTANNTVAIITVGKIARDISERYGVDPRKTASLLDSASCVVQCLIPYGAQTLLATSLAGISPAAPFPYLYYPWMLAIMISLSIIFLFPRKISRKK